MAVSRGDQNAGRARNRSVGVPPKVAHEHGCHEAAHAKQRHQTGERVDDGPDDEGADAHHRKREDGAVPTGGQPGHSITYSEAQGS